jgi:ABC-2 type transport system permease protein
MRSFRALYSLILRTQTTRARVVMLGVLGLLGVVIAIPLRGVDDHLEAAAHFIDGFGLTLVLPITTLVFASAALGDFIDDSTMVYLWMRPVRRISLALAAATATLTVVLPLVVIPLALAAVVTGAGGDLVLGTVLAAIVGVIAYTGLFVTLGVRVKRPLLWGLLYVLVWENFIARLGESASRLAIATYTRSILSSVTGFELRLADLPAAACVLVPIAVTVAALGYASHRLTVQDVA